MNRLIFCDVNIIISIPADFMFIVDVIWIADLMCLAHIFNELFCSILLHKRLADSVMNLKFKHSKHLKSYKS